MKKVQDVRDSREKGAGMRNQEPPSRPSSTDPHQSDRLNYG